MATRKAPEQPAPANLSMQQMQTALPKLQRRIAELQSVDLSTVRDRGESRFDALVQKVDDTLIEIFGNASVEYNRYCIHSLDTAYISMFGESTPLSEIKEGYRRGIEQAVSNLQTIVELFQEKLSDSGVSPDARAARAFGDLDLHPEIIRACAKLFRDGHYANAVEDACKVLDLLVKMRSGRVDLSGTDLMQTVFSPKTPSLKFNDLQTDTHKSEQQGMMYLYAGAMLALRNPRAHELVADHPERALEHINFLSMLAKSLDRATRS